MINLKLNDLISVTRSSTADLDIHVSWADWSAGTVTPDRTNTQFNTAATGTILAGPTGSVVRNAKQITIRNIHGSASNDVTVNFNQNGTIIQLFKATLKAGEVLEFIEGVGWFVVSQSQLTTLLKILTSDDTGGLNSTAAQPWFPTLGAVTVVPGTYIMDGRLMTSRSAGVTSHTTSLLFGGTATYAITYMAKVQVGDTMALLPMSRVQSVVATATVAKAASTSATEQLTVDLEGVLRVTAGGTFIPQFSYSAAPGGAPTILKNTRMMLTPVGDSGFLSQGTWS